MRRSSTAPLLARVLVVAALGVVTAMLIVSAMPLVYASAPPDTYKRAWSATAADCTHAAGLLSVDGHLQVPPGVTHLNSRALYACRDVLVQVLAQLSVHNTVKFTHSL